MSRLSGTTCLAWLAQELPLRSLGGVGPCHPQPSQEVFAGRQRCRTAGWGPGGLHRWGRLGKKLRTACPLTTPALASAGEGIENAAWVLDYVTDQHQLVGETFLYFSVKVFRMPV